MRSETAAAREEGREKQEVAPKKLDPPWDILVGSLWSVIGAFVPPGEILRFFFWRTQPPESRGQSVEKDVLAQNRFCTFFCWPEGGGTRASVALVPPDLLHRADGF